MDTGGEGREKINTGGEGRSLSRWLQRVRRGVDPRAAVGLYKIFVKFRPYKNQYYYSQTPPLFEHPTSPLHRPRYYAI